MKLLLILSLFSGTLCAHAQSDVLVLKQRGRTIQTWVNGSDFVFQYSNRQWVQGTIKRIQNDSLHLKTYVLRQVPNQFGFLHPDTSWMGLMKLPIRDVYAMTKRRQGSNLFTNGILLQMGSAAYIALNISNSILRGEPLFSARNTTSIGIAAGVFLLGKLLQWQHKPTMVLGKKYTLETIGGG